MKGSPRNATASLFALTVLSLGIAGCATTGADSKEALTTVAPAPAFSEDTGSLTGVVTDDEQLPLPLADVGVQGPVEAQTQTDAQGRFTLNDLPGGSYTVFAQRLGYESESRKADILPGEATILSIVLLGVAIESPRVETSTYVGFIDGDVYTAGVGLYYPRSFGINLTAGATEVVSSAKWESTVPVFARYLRMSLAFDDSRMRVNGRSPLTTNITDFAVEKAKEKAVVDYGVTFGCPAPAANPTGFVGCAPGNPDALVPQVAYQQRVDFYNAVFYYQRAPSGYTGLP